MNPALRMLESLADDLQLAAEQEADGFVSQLPELLVRLKQWLHDYAPST